jgi:hypothetical protein
MRRGLLVLGILCALAAGVAHQGRSMAECSSSYVQGLVGGESKCLRAGEFCSPGSEADYERYGFSCVDGRLRSGGTAPAAPTAVLTGATVALALRTRSSACRRGALPDRRCSPGAYYSGLTQTVICGGGFRTSAIRNVPQSEKFAVEREYGMTAALYGRTIELDHIVPLELGGSNDIANLFPEPGAGGASYHAKDRLENRLRSLVCGGELTLAAARRGVAADWERQYRQVFGLVP